MVDFLVFTSNMALGFAIGLWVLKLYILRDAEKKKILVHMSETIKMKLRLCGLAKYFFGLFAALKVVLLVMSKGLVF